MRKTKPNFKALLTEHSYNSKWYKLRLKMEWVFIREDKASIRKWFKKNGSYINRKNTYMLRRLTNRTRVRRNEIDKN